jgi:hypothetical protein
MNWFDAFDEAGDLVELGSRKRKGHLKSAPHRSVEQFGVVVPVGLDAYGRTVATCSVAGVDLGKQLAISVTS